MAQRRTSARRLIARHRDDAVFLADGRPEDRDRRVTLFLHDGCGEAPVSPGPEDNMAARAAHRGRLLAAQADREQAIGVLKTAFVQGRLTKDEFDLRVGQTFVSRTYAGLAAITADIPAELAADQPPPAPAPAQGRPPMSNAAKASLSVTIAVAVMVVATVLTHGYALVVFIPFYLMGLLVAAAQMLASRHEKRSPG